MDSFFCEICEEEVGDEPQAAHNLRKWHVQRKYYKERAKLRKQFMATKDTQGLYVYTKVKTNKPADRMEIEIIKWIPFLKVPLLGMEHVAEVVQYQEAGPRYYVCKLCGLSDINVVEHIISVSHRINYLVEHQDIIQPYIAKCKLKGDDKAAIDHIIATKGWPTREPVYENVNLKSLLIDISAKITNGMRRKRFTCALETLPSGIERTLQPPLHVQIPAHTYDDYPQYLWDIVNTPGVNFSLIESPGRGDGYNGGSVAESGPMHSMTMGQGHMEGMGSQPPALLKGANGKFTFLGWLKLTEKKLQTENFGHQEIPLADCLISLLDCGCNIFRTNPPPKEISYYPDPNMNPDAIPLHAWLKLTVTYFENAWMCSEREVSMSQALIQQLKMLKTSIQEPQGRPPVTMGMAARMGGKGGAPPYSARDPYGGGNEDPYAAIEESNFGPVMGGGSYGPSHANGKQPPFHHQHHFGQRRPMKFGGKPYTRP